MTSDIAIQQFRAEQTRVGSDLPIKAKTTETEKAQLPGVAGGEETLPQVGRWILAGRFSAGRRR